MWQDYTIEAYNYAVLYRNRYEHIMILRTQLKALATELDVKNDCQPEARVAPH